MNWLFRKFIVVCFFVNIFPFGNFLFGRGEEFHSNCNKNYSFDNVACVTLNTADGTVAPSYGTTPIYTAPSNDYKRSHIDFESTVILGKVDVFNVDPNSWDISVLGAGYTITSLGDISTDKSMYLFETDGFEIQSKTIYEAVGLDSGVDTFGSAYIVFEISGTLHYDIANDVDFINHGETIVTEGSSFYFTSGADYYFYSDVLTIGGTGGSAYMSVEGGTYFAFLNLKIENGDLDLTDITSGFLPELADKDKLIVMNGHASIDFKKGVVYDLSDYHGTIDINASGDSNWLALHENSKFMWNDSGNYNAGEGLDISFVCTASEICTDNSIYVGGQSILQIEMLSVEGQDELQITAWEGELDIENLLIKDSYLNISTMGGVFELALNNSIMGNIVIDQDSLFKLLATEYSYIEIYNVSIEVLGELEFKFMNGTTADFIGLVDFIVQSNAYLYFSSSSRGNFASLSLEGTGNLYINFEDTTKGVFEALNLSSGNLYVSVIENSAAEFGDSIVLSDSAFYINANDISSIKFDELELQGIVDIDISNRSNARFAEDLAISNGSLNIVSNDESDIAFDQNVNVTSNGSINIDATDATIAFQKLDISSGSLNVVGNVSLVHFYGRVNLTNGGSINISTAGEISSLPLYFAGDLVTDESSYANLVAADNSYIDFNSNVMGTGDLNVDLTGNSTFWFGRPLNSMAQGNINITSNNSIISFDASTVNVSGNLSIDLNANSTFSSYSDVFVYNNFNIISNNSTLLFPGNLYIFNGDFDINLSSMTITGYFGTQGVVNMVSNNSIILIDDLSITNVLSIDLNENSEVTFNNIIMSDGEWGSLHIASNSSTVLMQDAFALNDTFSMDLSANSEVTIDGYGVADNVNIVSSDSKVYFQSTLTAHNDFNMYLNANSEVILDGNMLASGSVNIVSNNSTIVFKAVLAGNDFNMDLSDNSKVTFTNNLEMFGGNITSHNSTLLFTEDVKLTGSDATINLAGTSKVTFSQNIIGGSGNLSINFRDNGLVYFKDTDIGVTVHITQQAYYDSTANQTMLRFDKVDTFLSDNLVYDYSVDFGDSQVDFDISDPSSIGGLVILQIKNEVAGSLFAKEDEVVQKINEVEAQSFSVLLTFEGGLVDYVTIGSDEYTEFGLTSLVYHKAQEKYGEEEGLLTLTALENINSYGIAVVFDNIVLSTTDTGSYRVTLFNLVVNNSRTNKQLGQTLNSLGANITLSNVLYNSNVLENNDKKNAETLLTDPIFTFYADMDYLFSNNFGGNYYIFGFSKTLFADIGNTYRIGVSAFFSPYSSTTLYDGKEQSSNIGVSVFTAIAAGAGAMMLDISILHSNINGTALENLSSEDKREYNYKNNSVNATLSYNFGKVFNQRILISAFAMPSQTYIENPSVLALNVTIPSYNNAFASYDLNVLVGSREATTIEFGIKYYFKEEQGVGTAGFINDPTYQSWTYQYLMLDSSTELSLGIGYKMRRNLKGKATFSKRGRYNNLSFYIMYEEENLPDGFVTDF